MAQAPAYKRVLLKLSGEALMGDDAYGINRTIIERIISEIAEVVAATYFAAWHLRRRAWTVPLRITWACWRR